jgi:hypothetical protein
MKIKLIALAAVFAAGATASLAFAHGGPGKAEDHGKGNRCKVVHVRGTIPAQTLNVTVERTAKRLNVAAGTTLQLQLGAAGQTVRVDALACQVVSGTSTVLQVKALGASVRTPKEPKTTTTTTTTTTAATTTAATTTSH